MSNSPAIKPKSKESFLLENDVVQRKQKMSTAKNVAFQNCLLQLKKRCNDFNYSAYDHLSDLIQAIFNEKPTNVIDFVDEFNKKRRQKLYFEHRDEFHLREAISENPELKLSQEILDTLQSLINEGLCDVSVPSTSMGSGGEKLVEGAAATEVIAEDAELSKRSIETEELPNILLLNHYWSLLGIGLSERKVFLLSCSMQKLKAKSQIRSVRFWGKIFGIDKNYYIVEAAVCQRDLVTKLQSLAESPADAPSLIPKMNANLIPHPALETVTDDLAYISALVYPQLPTAPIQSIAKDEYCYELNRNIYYVCKDINDEWIELPPVTQRQIEASRRVVRYFSGDLEADVNSLPLFPGCEKNYLRAVIARISSSTHISPVGAYKLRTETVNMSVNNDPENEPKGLTINQLCRNTNYKPIKIEQLLDLKHWVHHEPLIYEHGGITPLIDKDASIEPIKSNEEIVAKNLDAKKGAKPKENEKPKATNDKKNVGGKAAVEAPKENEQLEDEIDINQFKSCSDDRLADNSVAWKMSHSPNFDVLKNLILINSNIWQGASAMSAGTIYDNIYFGWGIKNKFNRCFDFEIPAFQREFENDFLIEMCDPTNTEEEAWQVTQKQMLQLDQPDETKELEPKPEKIDIKNKKNKK